MVGPDVTIVSIGGDQYARIVNDGHADRLRGVESSRATRTRAAAISSGVNFPLRCSHSSMAESPSRTTSARRAASVIEADTLTALLGGGSHDTLLDVGIDRESKLWVRVAQVLRPVARTSGSSHAFAKRWQRRYEARCARARRPGSGATTSTRTVVWRRTGGWTLRGRSEDGRRTPSDRRGPSEIRSAHRCGRVR